MDPPFTDSVCEIASLRKFIHSAQSVLTAARSHSWACAGVESLNDLTLTFTAVDAQGCTLPCFRSYSVQACLFLVLFSAMLFIFVLLVGGFAF